MSRKTAVFTVSCQFTVYPAIKSGLNSFKIKENAEMTEGSAYVKLNVEKYGGMLMAPWFDRPLSVAGTVLSVGCRNCFCAKPGFPAVAGAAI